MNRFTTPCFPQFRCKLAALGRRKAGRPQPSAPIDIEAQFKRFLPAGAPELPNDGKYRRNRKFPFAMVFWCFIWQVLKPRTSCREVVRQVQAFGETESLRYDESTSAYCQARLRLPESCLRKALADSAAAADRLSIRGVPGWSRPVKVVDGTGVSLPDTGANRAQYPYPSGQRPGCGFPNLKILGLYSLSSGAILQFAEAAKLTHDVRLFKNLWPELKPNDIAMGDRAFGAFFVMAGLPMRSVDVVARLHQRRLFDRRKARRIGPSDWIATWQRPAQRPTYIDEQEWNALPAQIEVHHLRPRPPKWLSNPRIVDLHDPVGSHRPSSRADRPTLFSPVGYGALLPGSENHHGHGRTPLPDPRHGPQGTPGLSGRTQFHPRPDRRSRRHPPGPA